MENEVVYLIRRMKRRFVVWMTLKGAFRIAAALIVILLISMLLRQTLPTSSTWSYWSLPLSGQTIAIDAGHGGADGGAVSKDGVIEKDLNLAIALRLRDYMQQAGAIVVMTREGDYDLASGDANAYSKRKTEDLKRRAAILNKSGASVVISIHMNSIPQQRWSGAQTFYHPSNHPDNQMLAAFIQNELKRNLENTTRVAAVVGDVYLMKTIKDVPAALVEVGFLSNPGEAARLADTAYQQMAAASIYQGVLRYMSGEKRSGSAQQEIERQNGL